MATQRWLSLLTSGVLVLGWVLVSAAPAQASHTVDPRFVDYYTTHQGPRVLGPAISGLEGNAQYFEKGRLEDHRGQGLPPQWEFMFGRLAAELVEQAATLPVAGESGPTYADLREWAAPGRRLSPPTRADGVQITETGVFIPYDARLRNAPGHDVPAMFWTYITRADFFPGGWLHDIGLPLTEAGPAAVVKGTVTRQVQIQAFERTVLTYDPANPADWQVERANIGVHYLTHRDPGRRFPDWKGEYFATPNLSGSPVLVRNDATIDFDWGSDSPGPAVPSDHFSVRWTRSLHVDTAAAYHVRVNADDGVHVWVASRLIVDRWSLIGRGDGYIWLQPGDHPLVVEYHEERGRASIEVDLDVIGDFPQWRGAYYNNANLEGQPWFVRNDARIDFNWGTDGPGSSVRSNDFSVRWTRSQNFEKATYRFTVTADDGVRLYVDGKRVLDQWSARRDAVTYTLDVAVKSGRRAVQLDYRDRSSAARVRLTIDRRT